MRDLLVISEFALALVLLTGAGLLIRSFLAVQAVDLGFRPERVLAMRILFPAGTAEAQRHAFYEQVIERTRTLPGVQAAGGISGLFELRQPSVLGLRSIEGRAPEPRDQWTPLTWTTVSGDYFSAMGTELLKGRLFSDQDVPNSPLVAIVDESLARRYWPGEDPIGKRFKGQDERGRDDEWLTVIGVVRDMRRHGPENQPTPHVFEWYRQSWGITPDLVVRTATDPLKLTATLRNAIRVTTMEEMLSEQISQRRFQTWLLGLFSVIALLLASAGIHGVMHYAVARRTHEIGIRMALGAQPRNVLGMVIGQGLVLALVGVAVGLLGSLWLSPFKPAIRCHCH